MTADAYRRGGRVRIRWILLLFFSNLHQFWLFLCCTVFSKLSCNFLAGQTEANCRRGARALSARAHLLRYASSGRKSARCHDTRVIFSAFRCWLWRNTNNNNKIMPLVAIIGWLRQWPLLGPTARPSGSTRKTFSFFSTLPVNISCIIKAKEWC